MRALCHLCLSWTYLAFCADSSLLQHELSAYLKMPQKPAKITTLDKNVMLTSAVSSLRPHRQNYGSCEQLLHCAITQTTKRALYTSSPVATARHRSSFSRGLTPPRLERRLYQMRQLPWDFEVIHVRVTKVGKKSNKMSSPCLAAFTNLM